MAKQKTAQLFDKPKRAMSEGPVECLGMTFENDAARRECFLERLRKKLKDPAFRKLEGFPIGKDEDILALSDPPYYTACPNPFIEDFINHYGKHYDPAKDDYHRKPFASDVSEGKNDPIYNAHSYHTKVPHKAIMRFILHFTNPGDVVYDGFCGSGMSGVASALCGDRHAIEELAYTVTPNGEVLDTDGNRFSQLGPRIAVQNDLSPAATFIASNFAFPVSSQEFESFATSALEHLRADCEWLYHTTDPRSKRSGEMISAIWSDVFLCNSCGKELVFWSAAIDRKHQQLRDEFPCPNCKAAVSKTTLDHSFETVFDSITGRPRQRLKRVPVEISFSLGSSSDRRLKEADPGDFALLRKCDQSPLGWHPNNKMLLKDGIWGDQWRKGYHSDVTHDYHFYLHRPLLVLSHFYEQARYHKPGLFWLTACLLGLTRLQRYSPGSTFPNMIRSGTLYIGSLHREWNVYRWLEGKSRSLRKLFALLPGNQRCLIGTWSSTAHLLPEASVDYIFVDPPFGDNLMYSELNFLWEGWLKVFTNQNPEAVISKSQSKAFESYALLMQRCFFSFYRALKPGRWMTVVFHNSRNAVWNAIQEALQRAGFVVADVRTIDKQQGSFNQIQAAGAVKKDLVISAYKPNGGLEERFKLTAGTEQGVWEFVRTHLKQLPTFVSTNGKAEVIAERQKYLLFDRMVAFHVQRGVTVALSAAEFYAGLRQRFPERDEMHFLTEQVAEYDRKRLDVKQVQQLELFVSNEKSAIQWVRQQFSAKPMRYQELQPLYMREAQRVWEKHEQPIELQTILNENFVKDDGADDPKLRDCWRVPDPSKEADLEQFRNRGLLREFQQYRQNAGKLKLVRTEALRAGFKDCWQNRDYATIVELAKRVPEAVIQEDSALLMYYDNALMRTEG